ncbi:inorganic phosphate transporter [Alloyangia pacifica]|uniref:Phosphate transporter n=1 Tax=Alloyangia pacifica TaxID=311180 RepID=A0A1I6UN54_9RHOB|nr:inorganic phosphate transporter [Alloyangia pacifica]SDH76037.1 inorganic phosphate transporter, PiT family [Alloyangia pacifica]SFT02828.1 inorganic phosphate transporter, PiT family [Alloyangia pacifica]
MTAAEEILRNLPQAATLTLILVFALIVLQEAVNGFHDAANAVATVIYSNSLKPVQAIVMAAVMNFLGVILGGTAVAFSIVFLLPTEMIAGINTLHEAALMLALIGTAVCWNLATWYYGIPNSTTHTYIGAVIGVSMAHALLVGAPVAEQLNLHEGRKILVTLLISPIFGFAMAWVIYKLIRLTIRSPEIYRPHAEGVRPPGGIRLSLIAGAAGVSFLHGSNDGQKSIGLMLMALMGLAPGVFAIDPVRHEASYSRTLEVIAELRDVVDAHLTDPEVPRAALYRAQLLHLRDVADRDFTGEVVTEEERIRFRSEILDLHQALGKALDNPFLTEILTPSELRKLNDAYDAMSRLIEKVPTWLVMLSAIALGAGTMVGYKRIVETLGEKMGDKHMSPAQGLAAQAAAMASIGAADFGSAPVSTTHVLTSGVAGAVQSSGDRMQMQTVSRILIAWVTTLPGTIMLSFSVALLLHVMLV